MGKTNKVFISKKSKNRKMSIFSRFSRMVASYQQILSQIFRDPRCTDLAIVSGAHVKLPNDQFSAENDIMERAILWNTPKKRKTIERRTKAKYGGKEWGNPKILQQNQLQFDLLQSYWLNLR